MNNRAADEVALLVSKNLVELKAKMEKEKDNQGLTKPTELDSQRLYLLKSELKEDTNKGYLFGKENDNFTNLDDQLESARRPLIDFKTEQTARGQNAGPGALTMKEIIKNKILAKKKQMEERNQASEVQNQTSVQREPLKRIENAQNTIPPTEPKIDKTEQPIPVPVPPVKKDAQLVQKEAKSIKQKIPSIEGNLLEGKNTGNTKLNFQRPISPIKKQKFLQHENFETDSEVSSDNDSPKQQMQKSKQQEFEELPLEKPTRRKPTPSPESDDHPERHQPAIKNVSDLEPSEPNKKSKTGLESSRTLPKKSKLARLSSGEYEKMVCKVQDIDLSNMRLFALKTVAEGQVIQCTMVRDRSGIINKFYPIFHLYLSVF